MKKLMLGNEAFARGLWEAGCSFISSYPGTPSTEITEFGAKYKEIYAEWAPNEKVAMESAFGASLAGLRSFCGMKHVGLNVAADPLFTISYTGVSGGMVIAVADDPAMHSSQNEQDSRHYARASKIPMLEPSDSSEAKDFVKAAYEISEEYDTPVLVRMCTRIAHCQNPVEICDRETPPPKPYEKNFQKYVMMPGMAKKRHPVVEERTSALEVFAETSTLNRTDEGRDRSIGVITSGTCYNYIKEVFGDEYPVLKLGTVWPMPKRKILDFAKSVGRVFVVEELDPFIETHCKSLGLDVTGKDLFTNIGEFSQNYIEGKFAEAMGRGISVRTKTINAEIPARPPVMCAGCPHRGIYHVLKKNRLTVLGDIGCYTLGAVPPLSAIDTTICMGASVSALHGFNKARSLTDEAGNARTADGTARLKTAAVIGDSTFMHSGVTGLINAIYNESDSLIVILDNSTTGMTGHQQNPTTGFNLKGDPCAKINLEELCRSVGAARVLVVDPYNIAECDAAVKSLTADGLEGVSVLISRRPCALLKSVKHPGPIHVDARRCIGCKSCMQIGCPAISFKEGKAVIDETQCTGCGICAGLCKVGAIGCAAKNADPEGRREER